MRETIEFVVQMFAIKAESQGVIVSYSLVSNLQLPEPTNSNRIYLEKKLLNCLFLEDELPKFLIGD